MLASGVVSFLTHVYLRLAPSRHGHLAASVSRALQNIHAHFSHASFYTRTKGSNFPFRGAQTIKIRRSVAATRMPLLQAVIAALLVCSGRTENNNTGASTVRVVVHADTLLEVDGQSTIPPLFGIMCARYVPLLAVMTVTVCLVTALLIQIAGWLWEQYSWGPTAVDTPSPTPPY